MGKRGMGQNNIEAPNFYAMVIWVFAMSFGFAFFSYLKPIMKYAVLFTINMLLDITSFFCPFFFRLFP